jgi:hypothetical protein
MTGWKLVPVEPTDAMLEAMQAAGLAAFDADVAASLGDTPLDPTHARRAVWQAALDAAPEAPSVEPVAYLYQHGETGRTRIVMPDQMMTNAPGQWLEVGPLYTVRPEGVRLTGEPVAWRISGPFGWTYQDDPPYESHRGRVAEPLYQHPQADHREVMRQALAALWTCEYADTYPESQIYDAAKVKAAIDALRKALGDDA